MIFVGFRECDGKMFFTFVGKCLKGLSVNDIEKRRCFYLIFISVLFSVLSTKNYRVHSLDSKEFQKSLPVKVVWAVPGRDAELPCDVTTPTPGDNVNMVFWFKDNSGIPMYSLDARGGPLRESSHLAMTDDLGSRSYFITDDDHPSKARLRIQNIKAQDQGVFRCRVDFINSPTRNFQINLTLVVQPSAPRVFDAEGREVKLNSSAGPFLEGHELFLSCQVTGGHPKPTLTWWYNGTILDGVVDSSRASPTIVNQLEIKSVPRHFKGARLECRATTLEIAGHVTRFVPLIVYLKPKKVKIVTPNDLLSSKKSQNIRCETSGSYPPAKLTWLLDGKPLRNADITEEDTDSFTGSILSLNVVAEDDGKDLVCRADNPRFPGGSAEDRRQIHVAYPPRVSVKLDADMTTVPVKEGANVTLRCEAAARPAPYSYSWYHDSHLVPYNDSGGILPVDHILTIRNIKQKSAGQYACSALNTEGETYSAPYQLTVQYSPRCKKGFETMRVGALSFESLVVQCHVDAIPEVTRFSWTYNTSRGVLPVKGAKIENEGQVSTLHFTPATDDLESLSCWATNSIGRQQEPCKFFIVPAEPPESPRNCIVRNATQYSINDVDAGEERGGIDTAKGGLEISCIAGKDGGLHQSFTLEVSDVSIPALPPGVTTLSDQGENSQPIYRVYGERPQFHLRDLEPGKDYQVMLYAENSKGRSYPPVVLRNIRVVPDVPPPETPLQQESETANPTTQPTSSSTSSLTLIVVGLTAAAVLLIVGIVTVATVIACRRPPPTVTSSLAADPAAVQLRRRRSKQRMDVDESELSEAGFGEEFHRRSAQYRASMYAEAEDRISRLLEGPDLIMSPVVSFSANNNDY